MVPEELNYQTPGAKGNLATCSAQGFLLTVGLTISMCYNCSICFYYLSIIRYNKSDEYIRKRLEPWFHGVSVSYPVLWGSIGLAMDGFNDRGPICLPAPYYPPHCIGHETGYIVDGGKIPCGRGRKLFESVLVPVSFFVGLLPPPIIIVTTMILMFLTVANQENKLKRYGTGSLRLNRSQRLGQNDNTNSEQQRDTSGGAFVQGVKKILMRNESSHIVPRVRSNARGNQKRAVLYMAAGYSLSWALVWIPSAVIVYVFKFSSLVLNITISLITPLQGLLNFIVFMSPKVRSAKEARRRGQEELSWLGALIKAYLSRGERKRRLSLTSSARGSLRSSVKRIALFRSKLKEKIGRIRYQSRNQNQAACNDAINEQEQGVEGLITVTTMSNKKNDLP